MDLPEALAGLLRDRALCFVATVMPSGAPQLTQTWVDTDGEHILINTVDGHQKLRNLRRDARVALNIADPEQPARYHIVRGRVVGETTDGAEKHIDVLAKRYTGKPYAWRRGTRVLLTIFPEKISSPV
jgi:PPOX class probable F420-dependent enzyme